MKRGIRTGCDHVPKPRTFEGWRAERASGMEVCDCKYADILEHIAVIDANPQFDPEMLHTIAARVGQLGYCHKTILRVLKATVKLDPEWFAKHFPEWCWDEFLTYTASFIAFGSDHEKAIAERTEAVKAHKRRGRAVKAHKRSLVLPTRYV